jgi:site-specific DNA recombinase
VHAVKTAIYCRISDDSTGERLGVTRQQEDCLELATSLGWDVHEIYTDNDISATSGKPRPEYRRMLGDVDSGLVDAIIAWHPDRLYRRPQDLGELVDVCKRSNAQIATVNAGTVDLTTPTGRMVAGLLAQVALYEVEHKAERWNRSYRQAREAGRIPKFGQRMFGWDRDGTVIQAEATLVREMAADLLAGKPVRGICKQLNAASVLTPRGNGWQPTTVRTLLRNPRLAGHSTVGYWETYQDGDKQRRRRKTRIVGEGQWEPILDHETWQSVHALLTSRSRPQPERASLLSGLIHCGVCEWPLITASHKNGARAYRCVRRPGVPEACGGVIGTAAPVESVVESYAQTWLEDPSVLANISRLRSLGDGVAGELDALQGRLLEIETAMAQPGESVQALLSAADAVRKRMGELQRRVTASLPRSLPSGAAWPQNLIERRRLVDVVVGKVWLDPSPVRGGRFAPERVRVDPATG